MPSNGNRSSVNGLISSFADDAIKTQEERVSGAVAGNGMSNVRMITADGIRLDGQIIQIPGRATAEEKTVTSLMRSARSDVSFDRILAPEDEIREHGSIDFCGRCDPGFTFRFRLTERIIRHGSLNLSWPALRLQRCQFRRVAADGGQRTARFLPARQSRRQGREIRRIRQ